LKKYKYEKNRKWIILAEKRGTLIIIGGAEDKKVDLEILKIVHNISGGKNSNIAIITTATENPDDAAKEYCNIFENFGVKSVYGIKIYNREQANKDSNLEKIKETDCIFFVGGDQLRISSILGGTKIHDAILKSLNNGKAIAGTSAGASMMSEIMVVEGKDDDAPRKCTLKMAPGMGLLQGVIIDQHFNQRGRIGRLLAAVAQNPSVIGLGIDENTAVIVDKDMKFRVVGTGVVTVVDGRDIIYTNISEQYQDEPLAITNVRIHVLPEGYGFNINTKQGIIEKKINFYGNDNFEEEKN